MNDANMFIGWTGTLATVSLGQYSDMVAILCGVATTAYKEDKLKQAIKKKD